jgi:hypothetical protein
MTHDPAIEAMRKRLENSLCPYEADQLRDDRNLRISVRDEAERIAQDMAAIYGTQRKAA